MSYDEKVKGLEAALALRGAISFVDPDEAETVARWYREPVGSQVYAKMCQLAEDILADAECLDIKSLLKEIGKDVGTKLSAIREAIRLAALNYLEALQQGKLPAFPQLATAD